MPRLSIVLLLLLAVPALGADLADLVAEHLPATIADRRWLHAHPELSGRESGTRAYLADRVAAIPGVTAVAGDWGGGLVWAALPARHKPPAVHALAAEQGGHAQVVRHGAQCPREAPLFGELAPGLRRLHENLKRAFDPHGILNPGRMDPAR